MHQSIVVVTLTLFSLAAWAEKDQVKLVYAWQPGVEIHVDYKASVEKTGTASAGNRELDGGYDIKTIAHKQGLRMDFSNVTSKASMGEAAVDQRMQGFIDKLAQISPSYVISKEGELVSVLGLTEMTQSMRTELDTWFKDAPADIKAKMSQVLDAMVSEAQVTAQIQQDWNRMVGQWVGGDFESGYAYEVSYETPVPFLNNAILPTHGQYKYIGPAACKDDEKTKRCVHLNFTSSVDQQALSDAMDGLFKKLGDTLPKDLDMKIDYSLDIITEPDTLYPHSLREVKVLSTPIPSGGMATQTEIKALTFNYKRP